MDDVIVTMKFASGQGDDSQWFQWRPSFFGQIIRVEWEKDTMQAELPADIANILISRGYATRYKKVDEVEGAAHKPSRSREGPAPRGKSEGEVDDQSKVH